MRTGKGRGKDAPHGAAAQAVEVVECAVDEQDHWSRLSVHAVLAHGALAAALGWVRGRQGSEVTRGFWECGNSGGAGLGGFGRNGGGLGRVRERIDWSWEG